MGVACEKSSTSFSPIVLAGDRAEQTQSLPQLEPAGKWLLSTAVLRCWPARTLRWSLGSKLPGTEITQQ